MSHRPLLYVFTLLLFVPLQTKASFEPGLVFPETNRYTCSSADVVGIVQAKEILAQLLPDLSAEYDQVSDYLYVNHKSGYKSHHFLFTLHKDNVPIYGQDITLSINEQCQLFRYQYHIKAPKELTLSPDSGKAIPDKFSAISSVKSEVSSDTQGVGVLLHWRRKYLHLIDKYGQKLDFSPVNDSITASPIYLLSNNALTLAYHVNVPLVNPEGNLELLVESVGGNIKGFYYKNQLADSAELTNAFDFNWSSYGSLYETTKGERFWQYKLGSEQKSLPLESLTKPESKYVQFYSNSDFDWSQHQLNMDYATFWTNASEKSRYQVPAILTNMQAIHDGFSYAAETLSYEFVGKRKVAIVLNDSWGKSDMYLPDFDLVLVGDDRCKGSTIDPAVTYHEQGHALFARLKLQGMPTLDSKVTTTNGGINEAFADYWASTLLSRGSQWDGTLAKLREHLCGDGIRNINEQEQDYFEGYESKLTRAHAKVEGDYGVIHPETLLAAPLHRARQDIGQNSFINSDQELINRYGPNPAKALADQIILEAFLGLSMYQQYQETAYAIYQSAKRLDPKNIAAPIFRKHFTNVNLMPRDVEPTDRTAFASPQSRQAQIALSSRRESQSGSDVTLSFGDLSKVTLKLAAGSKQEEWLDAPSVQCFAFQQSNLQLNHTLKDNGVLQNREYNMALVGGNKITQMQAKHVASEKWMFNLANDVLNDSNKKVLLRVNGNHGALLELSKEGSSSPIRFEQSFTHLGRYWYMLNDTASLTKGDWGFNSAAAKQADLFIVDCIPEFTVVLSGDRKENSQLNAYARSDSTPLNNVEWRIKEFSDSAMSGQNFSYTLPNLKKPQRITLEATVNLSGASRTVQTIADIAAVNELSSFSFQVPTQVDENSSVKFAIKDLTDPEGTDALKVEWFVNDAPVGEGTAVDWVAPEVESDTNFRISVKVVDLEDMGSVTEKRTTTLVKHINKAPVVSLSGKAVKQGETLSMTPTVSDADNNTTDLTFSWKVSLADGDRTYQGRTLTLPIDDDYPNDSISVEVVVSDNVDQTKASATVQVIKVNKAPVVTLSGKTSGEADSWVKVDSQITDESPSDVALVWAVTPGITWEKIGNGSIKVLMPKKSSSGLIQVSVTANDGELSGSASHSIRWLAYLNSAPIVNIEGVQRAQFGGKVELQAVGIDSDQWPKALSYKWTQVDNTTPVAYKVIGSRLVFDVTEELANARLSFMVTASDGEKTASSRHTVDIGALPLPQIVTAPLEQTYSESELVNIDASGSRPSRGKPLSYQWKQVSDVELGDFDKNNSQLRFTVPELSEDKTIEFELVVTEDGQQSSKRLVLELKNRGPKPRPVQKPIAVEVVKNDKQKSVIEIDATAVVELDENVEYQYYWRKVKGPEVNWIDRESKRLKVRLASETVQQMSRSLSQNNKADLVQMLGFELDLTTPTQGKRTYGLEVEVKQAETSGEVVNPPTSPSPSPAGGGGGGGGSLGWVSLSALLLLRRRR
ncbi:peptidase [Vibrio tubiashii]|uniref:Peptidase n=1 Tax=Vibrio tubiashii TaxID=29498 RepID=A0AAE5EW44_9VIBR|nr:peptidase [Vibrio tubiashii]